MSLKYKNFNESIIMRSYVNKALEKGLIKTEDTHDTTFIKHAASQIKRDEVPQNLNDKILKLCNKLRNSGFEIYADDLEKNFLTYKLSSQQLYNVSKETGEDVINEAHPDGSKKIIEDATADMGIIETTIDQKNKIEKIVNKQPTGKLAANVAAAFIKSSTDNKSNFLKRYIKAYKTVNVYKQNPGLFLKHDLTSSERQYALKWLTATSKHLNNKIVNFNYFYKKAEKELNKENLENFFDDVFDDITGIGVSTTGIQHDIHEFREENFKDDSKDFDLDAASSVINNVTDELGKMKKDIENIENVIQNFKNDYLK